MIHPLRWRIVLGTMTTVCYLSVFFAGAEIGEKDAEAGLSPMFGILAAVVLHAVRKVLDEALREKW